MKDWEKMPTGWIQNCELQQYRWSNMNKGDQIAALIIYLMLIHRTDGGYTQISYSALSEIAGISREKISGGLKVLLQSNLIEKDKRYKTTFYKIKNYGETPWGKVPVRKLYDPKLGTLRPFSKFHLRHKNELNALKLYFVIIAFRDNSKNFARISYDKIVQYTGVTRNDIRSALSLLVNEGLIHIDSEASFFHETSKVNLYRPVGLDDRNHRGTKVLYDKTSFDFHD